MLPKTHCDHISPGDNVIVGLGDSFTQGVGAYSLETWASMPEDQARYNINGDKYLAEQGANNWVRQLCRHFLPGYKTYNLGMNGGGNRATIKELSLYPLPRNVGNVIVILLATGLERYDFFKHPNNGTAYYGYGPDKIWHQKWQTIFPVANSDRGDAADLQTAYYNLVWSERNDILEFILNIKDLENLCKANGYKFLFAPAFNGQINRETFKDTLVEKEQHLVDLIDWNNYVWVPKKGDFMQYVARMEKKKYRDMYDIFDERRHTKMPSKYITPCSHWTIEGQYEVAKYLFKVISERGYV